MEKKVLLALSDVVAGYAAPVVGPLGFELQAGQVIGLGGSNGSGKSTLLRAITGLSKVFSGTIQRAEGLTIVHQWQRPELPPELALLGSELYALLGADPAGAPDVLCPLMKQPLSTMSGGQFQLLQTMAALCSPAQVVLMDEPTNNLDGDAMDALSEQLKHIGPDRAVILVSHEHDFLQSHCATIIEVNR